MTTSTAPETVARHVEHVHLRGSSVLSVTERQAKRCGLTVNAEVVT